MKAKKILKNIWYFFSDIFLPRAFACARKGQTTVEYMLLLATTSGIAIMFIAAFHKRILGGIFTIAGLILGAGTPK